MKNTKRTSIITLVLLPSIFKVYSQYMFRHWDVVDGMSIIKYDILQWHRMVVWSFEQLLFYKLSTSLSMFFFILAECMKMEEQKFNFDTSDDEEVILDDFLNEINKILNQHMNKETVEGFIKFFFS